MSRHYKFKSYNSRPWQLLSYIFRAWTVYHAQVIIFKSS